MKKLLTAMIMLLAVSFLQAKDKDRTTFQNEKHLHAYLHLENQTVYLIRDKQKTKLQKQLKLKDGTVVQPDGAFKNQKGDRLRLREGECIDMDGNWFANHEKMMERTRNRDKEMERRQPKMQEKVKGIEKGRQKNGQ